MQFARFGLKETSVFIPADPEGDGPPRAGVSVEAGRGLETSLMLLRK